MIILATILSIAFSYDCYKSRLPGNQAVSLGYPVSFSSSYDGNH